MKPQQSLTRAKWALMGGLALFMHFCTISLYGQLIKEMDDESKLYAQSKQLNQFFRRFNGEEDEKGNRYYEGDKHFRSVKLRKKYMSIIFNEENKGLAHTLKKDFVETVLDKPSESILDFHGGNWFAEVQTIFQLNGKDQSITLYMVLEKDHLGYKWVIRQVYGSMFAEAFVRDTTKVGRFLHPMSHELDFMNMRKAFANSDSISQFSAKSFRPDHLSVFLYELKKGNLKFKSVESEKFHFFQINGWYFEVANFNRSGYNTGWLISNLVKLKNDSEKNLLQRFLYNEAK